MATRAPQIEIGDTVKLRSNRSVRMSVVAINGDYAKVNWFAAGYVLVEKSIPLKALVKVEEGR